MDAAHLLHDLRLWPGVEEAERWHELADKLRSLLCSGAAGVGIKTKEALCQLFADDEGHPKKMSVDEFSAVVKKGLGVSIDSTDEDEEESGRSWPSSSALNFPPKMMMMSVSEDGLVDVGELLWKASVVARGRGGASVLGRLVGR